MESGGPSWEDEKLVYAEELPPPRYLEDRVERLGTWSYASAALAVIAGIVAVVAVVLAVRAADDGDTIDPADVERIEGRVLQLSNDFDEVREEVAANSEARGQLDEVSGTLEDLGARLERLRAEARILSRSLDAAEEEADERDRRLERTIDGVRGLSDRVDELEEDQ